MFHKKIDLREWRDWLSFLVGVVLPAITYFLTIVDSNIFYFVCFAVGIAIATVRLFVKEKIIRDINEEKEKLNKMVSQRWANWDDDEFSKNPEAWETLKDYLEHSFRVNDVPDEIRHKILFSLEDIIDYLSVAWRPPRKQEN